MVAHAEHFTLHPIGTQPFAWHSPRKRRMAAMWMAVFADVGVTVIAVLNAMRALKRG